VSEEQSGDGERSGNVKGPWQESKHFAGGGAPEAGDNRLLEDGSERGGALGSDIVVFKTASEVEREWWESKHVNGWWQESEHSGAVAH
jgi:hypothetical protein